MTTIRTFLLTAAAAVLLATTGAAAGAQSYSTTDDSISVTPSSTDGTLTPGADFVVTSTGWQVNTPVNAYLRSDPVFLGSVTANSVGTVTASLTIPAGTPAGDHHVELQGTDPSGNARVLSYAVTVDSGIAGSTPDALSFTGSTALPLVVAGSALTALGVTTLRFRRRRLGVA